MRYRYEDVMTDVRNILGEDCNGLYLSSDGAFYGDDQGLISHFDTKNPIFVNIENEEDVTTGASKLVIMPYNKSYVIKIPFTHIYSVDYNSVDDIYSVISESNYDICAWEDSIYEEASDMLQELLVPNIFVGLYNGCVPVYIQKKIKYFLKCKKAYEHLGAAALKITRKIIAKHYRCNINYEALGQYLHKFGITNFDKLCRELENIYDLHCSNWGFFDDGSVGIIDYGGYDSHSLYSI